MILEITSFGFLFIFLIYFITQSKDKEVEEREKAIIKTIREQKKHQQAKRL